MPLFRVKRFIEEVHYDHVKRIGGVSVVDHASRLLIANIDRLNDPSFQSFRNMWAPVVDMFGRDFLGLSQQTPTFIHYTASEPTSDTLREFGKSYGQEGAWTARALVLNGLVEEIKEQRTSVLPREQV